MAGLVGFLASLALKFSPVGRFLKEIPAKVWLIIALAAALALGAVFHQHIAHKALQKADATGYVRAKDEDKKALAKAHQEALEQRKRYEAAFAKVAALQREIHDAKIKSVDSDVAGILRAGTGKAGCRLLDYPSAPAAAGRHDGSAGSGGVAVDQVHNSGGTALLALPFNDTVRLSGQCDIYRDTAQRWNDWYKALAKSWPTH